MFGVCPKSISCLQLEIDTGKKLTTTFKRASHFRLRGYGCLLCGVPSFVCVLINAMCGYCNQNGCLYSWGTY